MAPEDANRTTMADLLAREQRLLDERERLRQQLMHEVLPDRREETIELLAIVDDDLAEIEQEKARLPEPAPRQGGPAKERRAQGGPPSEARVQSILLAVIAWAVTDLAGWPAYLQLAVAVGIVLLLSDRARAVLREGRHRLAQRVRGRLGADAPGRGGWRRLRKQERPPS
jgi:hypothetical protein